jgi:hypothetical protein
MEFTTTDILYSLGAFIGLVSFAIRDILWLRCVYSVASVIYIISGFYFGVISILIWNALTLLINSIQIIRLILERQPIMLPDYLKSVYLPAFDAMKPKEFLRFYERARHLTIKDKKLLTQGDQVSQMYFVVSGKLQVKRNNQEIVILGPGAFIGEMAFLTHQPASATVTAIDEAKLLAWNKQELLKLKETKPDLYMKFQSVLGVDLVQKLMRQSNHQRQLKKAA